MILYGMGAVKLLKKYNASLRIFSLNPFCIIQKCFEIFYDLAHLKLKALLSLEQVNVIQSHSLLSVILFM